MGFQSRFLIYVQTNIVVFAYIKNFSKYTPFLSSVCKARLLPFIHAALCEVGKYYSVILSECRVCPANTVAGSPGQTVCPCMEGFYRAEGEEEFPCISESNHDTPHNLCMIFDQSQTRGSSDCSKSTRSYTQFEIPTKSLDSCCINFCILWWI